MFKHKSTKSTMFTETAAQIEPVEKVSNMLLQQENQIRELSKIQDRIIAILGYKVEFHPSIPSEIVLVKIKKEKN